MSEIDPKLDATWRAASREQPPAALDDAIRAAAKLGRGLVASARRRAGGRLPPRLPWQPSRSASFR